MATSTQDIDGSSIDSGLTALLLTQASNAQIAAGTGIAIGRLSSKSIFSTCTAAASSCNLPQVPVIGKEYSVSVSLAALAALSVFPSQGTASGATATINGQAINTAVVVGPGQTAVFFCSAYVSTTGATWWMKSISPPVSPLLAPVAIKGAAYTITNVDHNKLIQLTHTTALGITLPAVAASSGLKVTVAKGGVGAGTATVVASAEGTNIVGVAYGDYAAGVAPLLSAAAPGNSNVNFAAAAVLGDRVTFTCNGTSWYAEATFKVAGGITFT
jgi:hypothetical protein